VELSFFLKKRTPLYISDWRKKREKKERRIREK